MNLKEIKEMLDLMADHGLSEMEVEKDGMKIKLRKGTDGYMGTEHMMVAPSNRMHAGVAQSVGQAPVAAAQAAVSTSPNSNAETVKSPMVGTFYSSPSPDQPTYVSIGQKVKAGDVLCIIEAMKLMNEIKSEVSGKVVEMLIENGQSVEFDQPLFRIEKG